MVQQRWRGRTVQEAPTFANIRISDTDEGTSTGVALTAHASALNKLRLAPTGDPSFGTVTVSCDVYTIPVQLRRATVGGDTINLATRAMVWYHFTDTAGAQLADTVITGTTGDTGVFVFPDTTASYQRGRIIANSTGGATIAITSTGTSTAIMVVVLANGLLVTGSTIVFT